MNKLNDFGVVPASTGNIYKKGNRLYDLSCSSTITANGGGLGAQGGALYLTDIEYKDGVAYVQKDVLDLDGEVGNNVDNEYEYRIRKLTPLTCWRLMGFSEEDFLTAKLNSREKAKELIEEYEPDRHLEMMQYTEQKKVSQMSNTNLYKQAGNSIVVDVLYYIYKELYKAMPYLFENIQLLSLFSGIGAFEMALNRLYETET